MILAEFSKYLQSHSDELLTHQTTTLKLLGIWIEEAVGKNPKTHADKIIHKEIMYAKNPQNDYIIVGKSDSGRVLVKALIEFAKSYKNYNHSKWMELTEKSYNTKDSDNSK